MSERANEQVLREGGGEAVENNVSKEQDLREGGGGAIKNSGGGASTLPVRRILLELVQITQHLLTGIESQPSRLTVPSVATGHTRVESPLAN